MPTRTSDELDEIGAAEELELSSMREDGTLRRPVTIELVETDDGASA